MTIYTLLVACGVVFVAVEIVVSIGLAYLIMRTLRRDKDKS